LDESFSLGEALVRSNVVNFLNSSFLVQTIATCFLLVFVDDIEPWMIWGYYLSPMMYGQNAIVMNEFLDKRWSKVRIQFSHSLVIYLQTSR